MTTFEKALFIKEYLDDGPYTDIDILNAIYAALSHLDEIEEDEPKEYDEEEEIELTGDASAVEDEFNDFAVYADHFLLPEPAVLSQQDKGERVHVPYTGRALDKVFGPGGC